MLGNQSLKWPTLDKSGCIGYNYKLPHQRD